MKKIIATLAILTAIIIACNTGNKNKSLLLKPDDIIADEYVINIDKDTTLQTKNGALLKIPKGSLATDKGNTVVLEIKEAYSMQQMILAGLTTQSDGQPLSSGGMIYINAKGGQNVTIKQAIKVAIPTDNLADSMQLFKGETDASGNLNWKEPKPLPENKQLSSIQKGEQLFQLRCSNCHTIGKDATGPNLAHVKKRFSEPSEGNWKYYDHGFYLNERVGSFDRAKKDTTTLSEQLGNDYYHPDPYYLYKCNLIGQFGSIGPRLFTDSSDNGLLSIYNYIQNESDKRNLSLPTHANLLDCVDSCILYSETITRLENQKIEIEEKRKNLIDQSPSSTEEVKVKTGSIPEPPVDFDNLVSPSSNKGVYYQFTIETFGWYNIDVLLSGMIGNIESELQVRITGSYKEKLDIFLIIPEQKIFLPQNARAYVLALTESESSIAFNLFDFTTSKSQKIEMELKSSTKEAFNIALSKLSDNNLKISVKDSENADSIRKTDADLKTINEELKKAENLKPKNCDCECGSKTDTVTLKTIAESK
jgi:mono/diheme cytochrome c family protein